LNRNVLCYTVTLWGRNRLSKEKHIGKFAAKTIQQKRFQTP
jgi:hypothetical protein